MAKPPGVVSPNKPLIEMKDSLLASSKAITDFIEKQPDEFDHKWDGIRKIANDLTANALKLSDVIMANVDKSLKTAIDDLDGKIKEGTEKLKTIKKLNMMINIASAILGAAVGVSTGGVIAGIPAIVTLGKTIGEAIDEAQKDAAKDDNQNKDG